VEDCNNLMCKACGVLVQERTSVCPECGNALQPPVVSIWPPAIAASVPPTSRHPAVSARASKHGMQSFLGLVLGFIGPLLATKVVGGALMRIDGGAIRPEIVIWACFALFCPGLALIVLLRKKTPFAWGYLLGAALLSFLEIPFVGVPPNRW